MTFRTVVAIAVAIAIACIAAVPHAGAQNMPHAIIGFVKDDAGNAMSGASVTLQDQRTGETLSTTTNPLGQYTADLTSMPAGYLVGDVIHVEANSGSLSGSSSVTVTVNVFDQCDITISEVRADSLWTFIIPIVVIVAVLAAVLLVFLHKPGKGSGNLDKGKGRRRQK